MKSANQDTSELFFIISPPADVLKQIAAMKRLVRGAIGRPFETECSIGHISLHKDQALTTSALESIGARLSTFEPFEIHMKDFSAFRNSKTIYLDIVKKGFIPDVFENITQLQYDGVPHVTVAKNLCKQDFDRAWNALNQSTYQTRFTCDRVKVLKKSTRRWIHYTDLCLKQSPMARRGKPCDLW